MQNEEVVMKSSGFFSIVSRLYYLCSQSEFYSQHILENCTVIFNLNPKSTVMIERVSPPCADPSALVWMSHICELSSAHCGGHTLRTHMHICSPWLLHMSSSSAIMSLAPPSRPVGRNRLGAAICLSVWESDTVSDPSALPSIMSGNSSCFPPLTLSCSCLGPLLHFD